MKAVSPRSVDPGKINKAAKNEKRPILGNEIQDLSEQYRWAVADILNIIIINTMKNAIFCIFC